MPLIVQFNFADGTSEVERIPAEIWKLNESEVSKVFAKKKEVTSIVLDPFLETADIDESNNIWPRTLVPGRFELFKGTQGARGVSSGTNPMKKAANK